ncbi:MAG: hypothetical protein M1376_00035 [Planctomycetes bacterium]|nr:hypothetical protein [Planctomycetota bacterium]
MNISRLATATWIVTGVVVSVAPAGAPMGSPTAYVGAGNWGVGAEYGYGQMDLEASGTVAEVTGSLDTSWAQHFRMDTLKSNMAFGTIAYGLMDTWDIFARLGATNAKDTIVLSPSSIRAEERQGDFDGSFGLAWGVGTRATLHRSGPWSIGGLVQFTWFRPGDSDFSITPDPWIPDESWTGEAKLHYWQAQASLAAAFQVDTWRLWAGPFVQYTQGDMDFSGATSIAELTGTLNWSSTIGDPWRVGGHFGANWKVSDQFNLWMEGQIASDCWLVGVGLVFVPEKSFGI